MNQGYDVRPMFDLDVSRFFFKGCDPIVAGDIDEGLPESEEKDRKCNYFEVVDTRLGFSELG